MSRSLTIELTPKDLLLAEEVAKFPRPPVNDKQSMYDRLLSGVFGNAMRAWPSLRELQRSGYRGDVSMRSLVTGATAIQPLYHVPYKDMVRHLKTVVSEYVSLGLVFSEAPCDKHRMIQGELMRDYRGLVLRYTFYNAPMRLAFQQDDRTAFGFTALRLLKREMDAGDLEDLLELLELYDQGSVVDVGSGPVVEFSCFRVPVGTMRRRMVIWEVRNRY